MLIHPWDAASDAEWREWLSTHDFGRAKFKFGGNKTDEDRERIGARPADRDGRLDAEALTQLRRRG